MVFKDLGILLNDKRIQYERTVERDARNETSLKMAGWRVITVWECELKANQREKTLLALCERIRNPHQSS